jgi:hypothetical protein
MTLKAGQTTHLALHRSTLEQTPAHIWSESDLAATVDATVADWRSWSALHQTYDGPWRDLVQTSGRVLQGLSFQPSGAIVPAATTSLPEAVGGERNWDYRYAWVRDASFTMQALWVAACPDEASNFFEFMTTAAASSIGRHIGLQIMFGVGGEHDLTERELHHLPGWKDSRPVRVGNGAWNQRQIDVYGELLGAAAQLSEQIDTIDEDTRPIFDCLRGDRCCLMDREGPRHLGGARESAALCVLQGHVSGRVGPGHHTRRSRPCLVRRLHRVGRIQSDDRDRRLPARHGSADARDD